MKITYSELCWPMCLLYKKNLIYVWDRKYHEFICNGDEEINIISNRRQIYEMVHNDGSQVKRLNFYRENYWQILNIAKPLKSITGYSRDDLVSIS